MSKPAAPPKSNFLTSLLLMVAVFLTFKLFLDPSKSGTEINGKEIKTSVEALNKLREIDGKDAKSRTEADQFYNDGLQLYQSFGNILKQDIGAKRTTEAESEDTHTVASIITAHIQLKNGIASEDTGKIRMAYQTLEPIERNSPNSTAWRDTKIDVSDKGVKSQVTGKELLAQLISTLGERNKKDYIWGFIPGGFQFIDFLVGLTGHDPRWSYAIATLLLAFVVRAVVFPLSQKQLMMSRQMSQLAPRISEIKEKFKDSPTEMNAKTMELYSRYGINPLAGCLPALVQMPLFLTVYQCILHYQFEFTHGYFLWINPQTSSASNGIFAPNLGQQDYLLIVIYGVSMIISTLLTPVTDPTQQKQQRMIGLAAAVIFPVMMLLRIFPVVSGFVLYWTFTNLFSMAQSIRAYRLPMPPLVEVNAAGGGVIPGKPQGRWATMMAEMQKAAEEQQRLKGEGGSPSIKNPPKSAPKDPSKGNGKFTPSRPADKDGGSGGTGKPAKHKPKKRS